MTSRPLLDLADCRVGYPEGFMLRIPKLTLHRGEHLRLQGANGSGKSTFLALLAGLLPLAQGRFLFDGEALRRGFSAKSLRQRRRIGLLLQEPVLFSGTVGENLLWPLCAAGMPRRERERRLAEWAERFELGALLTLSAKNLSVGQTRWVALARALISDPELILLDEPLASLDASHRALFTELLASLPADRHRCWIWTTHGDEAPSGDAARRCRLDQGHFCAIDT